MTRAMDAEQGLDLRIAKLRTIGVYTEEELAEARERMTRLADDPLANRVARQRVQNGSGG